MSDQELPPPTESDLNPPAWADMSMAVREEKSWPDEKALQGVKRKNDVLWHRTYGIVVVIMMIFLVLIFIASLGVWVFHYVTPWQFLTSDQLSKIQSVIFSGSLGAIVSAYMQRQLSK